MQLLLCTMNQFASLLNYKITYCMLTHILLLTVSTMLCSRLGIKFGGLVVGIETAKLKSANIISASNT